MPSAPTPPLSRSRIPLLVAATLLLTASGCTVESKHGDVTTFAYAWWTSAVWFLLGVGLCAAGLGYRKNVRFVLGNLVAGVFVLLCMAPSYLLETAQVSNDRFLIRTGTFPFMSFADLKFADLSAIHITSHIASGRKTRRMVYALECHTYRAGGPVKIDLSFAVGEPAAALIVKQALLHHVAVKQDSPTLPSGVVLP